MAEYRTRQKLTDDDVRRLLTSEGSYEELSVRFGINKKNVWHYRARKSKRALRIARELGLPPLDAKTAMVPDEDSGRAYVVHGVRG